MKQGAIILKQFKCIHRVKENNRYIAPELKCNWRSLILQIINFSRG